MTEEHRPDVEEQEQQVAPEPYVPPQAEDIDTTHDPAETAGGGPGVSNPTPGVEESGRWH